MTVFMANYAAPVCNKLLSADGFLCIYAYAKSRTYVDLLLQSNVICRYVASPSDLKMLTDSLEAPPDIVVARGDAPYIFNLISAFQPLAFAIVFLESKRKDPTPPAYQKLVAQLQRTFYELTTSIVWLPSLGICENKSALVLLGARTKLPPLQNGGTMARSVGEILADVVDEGTAADRCAHELSDADRALFHLVPQGGHLSAVPKSRREGCARKGSSLMRLDPHSMPKNIPNVVSPLVFFGHPTEDRSLTLREMSALVGVDCEPFADMTARPTEILAADLRPALVLHICRHIRRSLFTGCEAADVPIPTPERTKTKRVRAAAELDEE